MIEQERADIAGMLLEAYASRTPVEPLTSTHPGLTVEDAYQVQLLQVARWQGAGAQVAGHKVGLTSAAMQRQLGVDQPDYGHLLDGMFWLGTSRSRYPVSCSPGRNRRSPSCWPGRSRGRASRSRRPSARSATCCRPWN